MNNEKKNHVCTDEKRIQKITLKNDSLPCKSRFKRTPNDLITIRDTNLNQETIKTKFI